VSPYREALAAADKTGVSRATDAQLMATFCASSIQIVCGAVSPELVWDGAQKSGLTTLELARLASTDPRAVEELMWL
jgi:hypothetical protein